ncbi:MAG: hypothetical protein RIS08_145 [Actinomycetota bacterium]
MNEFLSADCGEESQPRRAGLLKEAFSQIYQEWHPTLNGDLDPATITSSSNRKVFWLGPCGHEWQAVVASRTRIGAGCPFCANQSVLPGFNDLESQLPALAAEWDAEGNGVPASQALAGGNKKYRWNCAERHIYVRSVTERKKGLGCDYCSGKKVLPGFNDLETRFPLIALEWNDQLNGNRACETLPSSTAMSVWTCGRGHNYKQSASNRTGARGAGCPYCSSQRLLKGHNDLASVRPELAQLWDFEGNSDLPEDVFAYSNRKFNWLRGLGHSWSSSPTGMKGSCPYCVNQKVWPGFNDLATLQPELASEWDEKANQISASQVSACGRAKAHWICAGGHRWIAAKYSRCAGTGCPFCSNKSEIPGPGSDLQSLYPEVASEWDYNKNSVDPSQVFPSSGKSFSWICRLGHGYVSSPNTRIKPDGRLIGCPTCSGRRVLEGFNDLASRFPHLAKEWHLDKNFPLLPSQVTSRAKACYWWVCSSGHEWMAAVYSRANGNGCAQCAQFGFKPHEPAVLYFIQNTQLGARKIGITNLMNTSSRISRFEHHGWEVIHTAQHSSGSVIRELERRILRSWIRDELQMPAHLGKRDMRGIGGETETFGMDGPSNELVVQQIQLSLRALSIQN